MDAKTLKQAAALVETNPKAAYDLLFGVDPVEEVARDPKTAFDLVLARGREVPMGDWDGTPRLWPQLPEFEFFSERVDRFKDTYEAMYQYVGGQDLYLFVTFYANDFVNSEGNKPGKYEARYQTKTEKGSWDSIGKIPGILRSYIKKAAAERERIKDELLKVGGPGWDVTYDWGQLVATFENPDRYSDATMDVTFEDVDAVVFGDQDAGEASISYAAGADYEGFYGQREAKETYRTIDDIKKVLKKAEQLWKSWIKPA